ncbi:MAG TPA: hypothetical protein VND65_23235 [Candidatus Binatia bacterium]|nr:hypothetical protein [Candidatus Binatia bacterium]
MNRKNNQLPGLVALAALNLLFFSIGAAGQGTQSPARPVGPTGVLVHSKFGGQIFGHDIDQNGTEGLLSEAVTEPNGEVLAAVETFNQASGKILTTEGQLLGQDDFLTLGVVGTSVGLVEREHVTGIYVTKRIYEELNPLSSNKFTGTWKAPLAADQIIIGVSRTQSTPTTAVLAFDNNNTFTTFVFGTDVAANTFGPMVTLTDPTFQFANTPQVGYDSATNQAVVAASDGTVGGPAPQIALVDLTTGAVTQFTGILGPPPFHQGFINGLAVDAEDGIAVTTTELDFRVEFYDLATQTGFSVVLPNANGQLQSGTDVEYDPVNKLFFVAQSFSSTGQGSSIQVYDPKGTWLSH